jgi:hypothetical protein
VYDGDVTIKAYTQGQLRGSKTLGGPLNTATTDINRGALPYYGWYFNGIIGEVRISDTVRDGNWIQTSYNNTSSPSTFISLAASDLWVSIYYSSVKGSFSNAIVTNKSLLNLGLFTCEDSDFSDYTLCSYSWDTNVVIDGNYYIDINVYDADAQFDTDSSDSSFMVDNTAPSTADNAPAGWQEQAFTVTLTCPDGTGSGCELVERYYCETSVTAAAAHQCYKCPE